MVLIPETEYDMLTEKPMNKEDELKLSMNKILAKKPTHASSKQYSQLLSQYLHFKNRKTQPKAPIEEVEPEKEEDMIDYMRQFIPPIYHNKVKVLLKRLHEKGVKWNSNKELILKGGHVVSNSNIADLVKEALVATKRRRQEPTGWKRFVLEIARVNMPMSFFTKASTAEDIRAAKYGQDDQLREEMVEPQEEEVEPKKRRKWEIF